MDSVGKMGEKKNVWMVLLEAAELVDRGWAQRDSALDSCGKIVSPHDLKATCFCALGAIRRATGADPDSTLTVDAVRTLANYLGPVHFDGLQDVVRWNDSHKRTKQEVVYALKAAALQGIALKAAGL